MPRIHNLIGRPAGRDASAQACLRRGQSFMNAASIYLKGCGTHAELAPFYVNAIQAIELMLKAFLHARGVEFKVLAQRKYGHNLAELLREVKLRNFSASDHDKMIISELSKFSIEKTFEYVEKIYFSVPQLQGSENEHLAFERAILQTMSSISANTERAIRIDSDQDRFHPNQPRT